MSNYSSQAWANVPAAGLDLFLDLTTTDSSASGLRARIERGLREAIRSGRLPVGSRLPPTRELARDLGVSRGTVLQAYEQLVAEGWLQGRTGFGTIVRVAYSDRPTEPPRRERQPVHWQFDFRPGRPDPSSFPRRAWLRAARQAIGSAPNHAFSIGAPQGQLALRMELAAYLSRVRGLQAPPTRVVVTSGFIQSLGLVARSLGRRPGRVAMEDPCLPLHRAVIQAQGCEVLALPVDGEGLQVAHLYGRDDVGLVVVTPNRQHPTGAVLSPQRRAQLLAWARRTGALILEDDYDGEFRYDRHPVGALQSLGPEVVAYAGTLSKTLSPAVRLGWLVVPKARVSAVVEQKSHSDWQSGVLEQLTFAEFLRSGAYDRHVRRMRLGYRQRRDAVVRNLARVRPDLPVVGAEAGLDLLVPVTAPTAEASTLTAAAALGIGLGGLAAGGYYRQGSGAGVLVGYGAALEATFARGLEALSAVFAGVS